MLQYHSISVSQHHSIRVLQYSSVTASQGPVGTEHQEHMFLPEEKKNAAEHRRHRDGSTCWTGGEVLFKAKAFVGKVAAG